jgi:hypothetical protein
MSEIIRLKSNTAMLPAVISSLVATHRLIENRDIGDFVGMPVEGTIRAEPFNIKLTVFFFSEKYPPFTPKIGKRYVRSYCAIPDVKRSSLAWEIIKLACGGDIGYMWGRFTCTANLSNRRQMQVYGASAMEAEERLKALAALSKASITSISVSEQKKEGKRATGLLLYKEPTRVYPAYFSILNSQKIAIESKLEREQRDHRIGKLTPTLDGNFLRNRTQKIPLWVPSEPPDAKAQIREAIRVRTK